MWEPTRDGKAPRDKGQWEALPPLDMKGKVEGRQGMWCGRMKAGGAQHKNPAHTQVQVERGGGVLISWEIIRSRSAVLSNGCIHLVQNLCVGGDFVRA